MDIPVLATTVVANFLLPYVKMGAEKIASEVTKHASEIIAEDAVQVTESVWQKVKSLFASEGDENIIDRFETTGGKGEDLVTEMLTEKLENNQEIATELNDLVNPSSDSNTTAGSGASIMKAHIASIVDLRNANFSNSSNVNITGISTTASDSSESVDKNDNDS